jgi:hypothetical protein
MDDNCDGVIPTNESDPDSDGVLSCLDNCPIVANPDQADRDGNGIGDACDNHAPVANAGLDQSVATAGSSATVTLDGSGSSDPDLDALTYTWIEGGKVLARVARPAVTLAVGTHIIVLAVSDPRGARATDTVVVTVKQTYSWSGVLQPINPPNAAGFSSSVFKAGSTVAVNFLLTGGSAGIRTLAATFTASRISSQVNGQVNEAVSYARPSSDNRFRFDAATRQYTFNWGTKGLAKGTYRLSINLGDGVSRTVSVGLK